VNDQSAPKKLEPVKPVATYELVADQIQRAIHLGLFIPGERLPAERNLAQQLGVARMTVREAIRVLEQQGRITVRRGARGGMFIRTQEVSIPELTHLAADTDRAIADVYEFREIAERASARLAAKRATARDVRRLRELSQAMEGILAAHFKHALASHIPEFLALDSQFHNEIARISGNPYVCEAIERGLAARYASFGAAFRELKADATKGHEEVIAAIASHDGDRAEKIMSTHVLSAYQGLVSLLKQHVRAQKERAKKRANLRTIETDVVRAPQSIATRLT
jgi:GntR family transcriptional repressor for pyruvate dehydrogenase complex